MPSALRFLLVEDQQLMCDLLQSKLQIAFPGCEIVEKHTLAELETLKQHEVFDLAIVDLQLPDGNAMTWVDRWTEQPIERRVLLVTGSDGDAILHRAFHSRVQGFVHKTDASPSLISAINAVLGGEIYFSNKIQQMRTRMKNDPHFFDKIFSEREQAVLPHFARGMRNEEIAELMELTPITVQDYRRRIMGKLNVHREADLIRWANRMGFGRITDLSK